MIYLSACAKIPKVEDQERCLVSIEHQTCFCHQYRISEEFIGRVSETVDKPLNYCEKFISFSPESWVEYYVWLNEIFDLAKDNGKIKTKPEVESKADLLKLLNK